jgi:subtilisin family serine protease
MHSTPLRSCSAWLVSLSLVTGLTTGITGQDNSDQPYRQIGEKRISLRLDHTRLALQVAAPHATTASVLELAAAAEIATEAATPTAVPGWFHLYPSTKITDAGRARQLITKLLRRHPATIECAAPVFHGEDGHWVTITRDILMQHTGPALEAGDLAALRQLDPKAEARPFGGLPGAYSLRHPSRDGFVVLDAANQLAREPSVAWAEPDWQFSGQGHLIPNDPGWPQLWGMLNTGQFSGVAGMDMDAERAWDITTGQSGIWVLVLDTGVQQNHPDINQVPGVDTTSQIGSGGPINGCDNHGTAVAGCVSAIINNKLGTVGIAPNCRTFSARCFISTSRCNGSWNAQGSWTVNALEIGRVKGAKVSNNSNGYGFTSSAIEAKYSQALANGMIHFASGGNGSRVGLTYPASLPMVNGIAALNSKGNLAGFSNRGAGLMLSGPGVNVYTTDRTGSAGYRSGDYTLANGTSFASPYSAGIAALLASQNSRMTPTQIGLSMRACFDLGASGFDSSFGWGFVNANSALRCTAFGSGLAGTGNRVPELFAMGRPRLSQTLQLRTEAARGGARGIIVVGATRTSVPFFGGRLWVAPPSFYISQAFSGSSGVAGAGKHRLAFSIPNQASLIGARVVFQSGIVDPGAVQGLALSNGLDVLIGR